MSTLNDAFDGYNEMCVSLLAHWPLPDQNAAYVLTTTSPASIDATVPSTPECSGRQYVSPLHATGGLNIVRSTFHQRHLRMLDKHFTNTTVRRSFNMTMGNNLGSDNNTRSPAVQRRQRRDDRRPRASFQGTQARRQSDVRLGHTRAGRRRRSPSSTLSMVTTTVVDSNITLQPARRRSLPTT